jgi:hypothetical protein
MSIPVVDEASGEGIGVARYVRDPKRPDAAEVAVTAVDDWQERGTIEIEMPLAEGDLSPALRKLLRELARSSVSAPLGIAKKRLS